MHLRKPNDDLEQAFAQHHDEVCGMLLTEAEFFTGIEKARPRSSVG